MTSADCNFNHSIIEVTQSKYLESVTLAVNEDRTVD